MMVPREFLGAVPTSVAAPEGVARTLRLAVVSTRAPGENRGGMVTFDTVTLLFAGDRVFPAASRATALRVWVPLVEVVVFHAREYGEVVASAPTFAPSTLNCTPTTSTLSDALAERVTVPETVELAAGAVRETVGKVVSSELIGKTCSRKFIVVHVPGLSL